MMLTLIEADYLFESPNLRRAAERFHLVYCDPPFKTQKTHTTKRGERAFTDQWVNIEHYTKWLSARCAEAWELLANGGSLVVHVDPRTSHYVKVDLDRLIGDENFTSEIIWRYRRWPTKTLNFQRMHDVLLRYVKGPKCELRWTQLYEPLAESTRRSFGDQKQRANVNADGRRTHSSPTAETTPGVPMSDVWEIGILAPPSKERTGYPTQKPEALLERLVLACTQEGDRVLDPMCGSGTTLAVADRLGRHGVGIDSSPVAIRYARKRLSDSTVVVGKTKGKTNGR